MVAMSGAIMPDPLAMPAMVTLVPLIWASLTAPLGKVSVVMMALAASSHLPGARSPARASRLSVMDLKLSGSPITPVDAANTRDGRQARRSATASTTCSTASSPSRPVKALALPELTTNPLAMPPGRDLRHQSTGADAVSDLVNTPAAWVSSASSTSRTSVRPL